MGQAWERKTQFLIQNESGAAQFVFQAEKQGRRGVQHADGEFRIDEAGNAQVENGQKGLFRLLFGRNGKAFAASILSTARECAADALPGRTAAGLVRELRIHYVLYRLKVKRRSTIVTDLGGTEEGREDYDPNARFFEAPLRNLDVIWETFFRR